MRVCILSLLILSVLAHAYAQQIAITFDDAPLGNGPLFSGDERAQRILKSLSDEGVDQVAFFVVSSYIDSSNVNRVLNYEKAGHLIANHSHTHPWPRVGTANYIRDIQKADSALSELLPYTKWYRYPYLDEGRTRSSRDSIRLALTNLGLSNGYVTVDNYDWHLNAALRKAIQQKKEVNYERLKGVYLDHLWQSILFYDGIAKQVLGRSPRHVLLLHENDLAALFIGDLIKLLRKNGWQIISPADAYTDPIASHTPDVLFNGQGRVGAIAFEKGLKPADLIQKSEDEDYLDQLLKEKRVFLSR